jgi:hypothetical protein
VFEAVRCNVEYPHRRDELMKRLVVRSASKTSSNYPSHERGRSYDRTAHSTQASLTGNEETT